MDQYQKYKDALNNESYPLAILDLNQLQKNIHLNIARSKGKNIRIASKSIRCRKIMELIQKEHDQFQGIMSYHAEEAIFLSRSGFNDILLGYPVVDINLIHQIGNELKKDHYICLMVDDPKHLELIQKEGEKLNVVFPVCIDIDLSIQFPGVYFGVKRSPVNNKEKLIDLLTQLKKYNTVRLDGLMGYEAQIAGLADSAKEYGLKNKIIQLLKKRSIPKIKAWRKEAIDIIKKEGFKLRFVNGGGTGSVRSTIEDPVITEVTIGSGFFNPHLFDNYQEFQFHPALFFGIQIIRIPKKGTYTCHGGGFIASGGIEKLKAPKIYLPKNGKLDKNEGAGEVQTPVIYDNNIDLKIGDPVFLRHAKSGELCERFNELIIVKDHKITSRVKTYRGEGLSFG